MEFEPRSRIPTSVQQTLAGPGRPLETEPRAWMESQFGFDFSAVRIHDNAQAATSAKALRASAYTAGSHIVFGAGAYRPHEAAGAGLLAHELTHVLQRRNAATSSRAVSDSHDAAEAQSDQVSRRVGMGQPARLGSPAAPAALLSRAEEDWFRGFGEGVAASTHAGVGGRGPIHDLGPGTYFTDSAEVADIYAEMRAADPANRRIVGGKVDPGGLGKVLDLSKDPEFMQGFDMLKRITRTVSGENYWKMVEGYLTRKNLKLEDFDVLIGPEGIRGGRQMCVRDPKVAAQIVAKMAPVKPGGPPSGGGKPGPAGPPPTAGGGKTAPPAPAVNKPSLATGTTPAAKAPAPTTKPTVGGAPKLGGRIAIGLAKAIGPMILVALNNYLMAREDAKKMPGRIEQALADQKLESAIEELVDRNRLDIARKQHRGVTVYVTVQIALTFYDGLFDHLNVRSPKLSEKDQSHSMAPIVMSHGALTGIARSEGFLTQSVPVGPVEVSRSEELGFELEELPADAAGEKRGQLESDRKAALAEEEAERKAAISQPAVIQDPKKRAQQQAQITERLGQLNKDAPQQAKPKAEPTPLLAPPGATPVPRTPALLPGAPTAGPIEQAAAMVAQFKSWTTRLLAKAATLDARLGSDNSPTPAERQGFLTEEENWRLTAKFLMNKYSNESRSEAVNAIGERLDRDGPSLAGTRTRLGG